MFTCVGLLQATRAALATSLHPADPPARMHSGSYPSTSPASFSRETSFLQQAVARGQTSLHGAGAANSRDESALDTEGAADEDRGRAAAKRRSGGGRASRSSFSVDGRLSPTQEGEEEATASEGEGVQQPLLSRVRPSFPCSSLHLLLLLSGLHAQARHACVALLRLLAQIADASALSRRIVMPASTAH